MYRDVLLVLHDIASNQVSAQNVLDETMRVLVIERDKRKASIERLLNDIKRSTGTLPPSAEDTVTLIEQHLACKKSSRLPVLVVAAAYQVASQRLGERILRLHSHTAADEQTGAAGDIEITLLGDDSVVTTYEMKMKPVLIGDINIALKKIAAHKSIQHYIFITTHPVDAEVYEYAVRKYAETGGVEIAILDCVGFLRHFLHLFYRLRTDFLNAYQNFVLKEPDSAVSHALKEAFLALRRTAEGAE